MLTVCGGVVKLVMLKPSAPERPIVSQFGSFWMIGVRIAFTFCASAKRTERVCVSARSVETFPSMNPSASAAAARASDSRALARPSRPAGAEGVRQVSRSSRVAVRLAAVGAVALRAALDTSAVATTANVRLTNDTAGGYVSAYTLATGNAYTDDVIKECAISRGRQNE